MRGARRRPYVDMVKEGNAAVAARAAGRLGPDRGRQAASCGRLRADELGDRAMTNTVYVGVTNRTGGSFSGLFRRPEDRDKWEFCDAIKDTHVHAIAVHPENSAVGYAATRQGLLRREDG